MSLSLWVVKGRELKGGFREFTCLLVVVTAHVLFVCVLVKTTNLKKLSKYFHERKDVDIVVPYIVQ